MTMCKFCVGDEVEILPFEELKKQADAATNNSLYFPYCTFKLNEQMRQCCGKKTRVTEAFNEYEYVNKEMINCYRLEIDNEEWTWVEQWLRKA